MKRITLLLFAMTCFALVGCVQQTAVQQSEGPLASNSSSSDVELPLVDSYVVNEYYTIVPYKIDDKLRMCGQFRGNFSIDMPKQEAYCITLGKVVNKSTYATSRGKEDLRPRLCAAR
jgi:hypothetical protein